MKSLRVGALGIALLALGVTCANADGIAGRGRIQDGSYAAPDVRLERPLCGRTQSDTLSARSEFSLDVGNFFDINLSGAQSVCYASATISSSVRRWVLGLFADYAFGDVDGSVPALLAQRGALTASGQSVAGSACWLHH